MKYYDKLSPLINEYTRPFYLKAKVEICYPNTYLPIATIKYLNSDQYKQDYNDLSIEIFKELSQVRKIENRKTLIKSLNESLEQVKNTYNEYRIDTPIDETEAIKLDAVKETLLKGNPITKESGIRLLVTTVAMRFSIHCKQVSDLIDKTLTELENNGIRLNGDQSFRICSYDLIKPIYDICIREAIFTEQYDLIDFINCFDGNYNQKSFPPLKIKPKFCFILAQLDGVNEKIAINYFGVKGYKTQKNREINKRKGISNRNKLFVFTQDVYKIFK